MTQPVEDTIAAIVVIIKTVSGITQVPVNPPDTVNTDTFVVTYPLNGVFDNGVVGTKKGLHNISVDLLRKRTDLARDIAAIKPFVDTIPIALLADPTLGATVQTFEAVRYELIMPDYGGVPTIGYKFTITNAKILA
jgi:hypothetical protein